MSLQSVSDFPSEVETIVDVDGNPWFKRAHVGKFLGFKHIDTSVEGLDKREIPTRHDIKASPNGRGGLAWAKDQQNRTDKFLSKKRCSICDP